MYNNIAYSKILETLYFSMEVLAEERGMQNNDEDSCNQFSSKRKKGKKKENEPLVYSVKGTEFSSCTIVFIGSYSTA